MVVYAWEDAPEELLALSRHGGDEDYVVILENTRHWTPMHLLDGDEYVRGWGNADWHYLDDGLTVVIFAHA
jgi:hypothetical protein